MNTALTASICFRMMMSYLMTQHVLDLGCGTLQCGDDEYIREMAAQILYGLSARPAQAAPGSA